MLPKGVCKREEKRVVFGEGIIIPRFCFARSKKTLQPVQGERKKKN